VSGWRTALRRELTLWLILKAAALAVLWGLFFSPAHRPPVTAVTTSHRFALQSPAPSPAPPPERHSQEEIRGDRFWSGARPRLQFALTALYHFLFVPLTLGCP
jgi:hypothetical protein